MMRNKVDKPSESSKATRFGVDKPSDEAGHNSCGPCKDEGMERESKHYCEDCREFLCDPCKEYHGKFKMSKNHKILTGNAITATRKQKSATGVRCSCSQNRDVEVYCSDHDEVVCRSCHTIKHRTCKSSSILSKSSGYSMSVLSLTLNKAKSLQGKTTKLIERQRQGIKQYQADKEECINQMKSFRQNLNSFYDMLERIMLKELEVKEKEKLKNIEQQISTLTTVQEALESDFKLLEDARKVGTTETMFASDVKVSTGMKQYEALIQTTEKGMVHPRIHFEGNKKLLDLPKEVKHLGTLKTD